MRNQTGDGTIFTNTQYTPPHINIYAAYTAGLVAKKGQPWAKDSIDFLALVGEEGDDAPHDGQYNNVSVWGVEIKSRLTTATITNEEEYLLNLNREKHVSIPEDQVYKYIRNVSERFQLLHHSFVYGLDKSVLIVGDEAGDVIQSTVVNYSTQLKDAYGEVL